jgi:UDP-3-O-[3-hydroxymyristoyl] glucosamine N-acyltransferase
VSAPRTLRDVTELVGGELEGSADAVISGVATLADAQAGDLTFLANPRYRAQVAETAATAILMVPGASCPESLAVIRVDDPYAALQKVAQWFDPGPPAVEIGIHPSAVVAPDAVLGEDVGIGPHCVVEAGVHIGDRTRIAASAYVGPDARIGCDGYVHPSAYVGRGCRLGDRVIVQPGAVIGSDGFGYAWVEGAFHRIPQVGIVVVEDDVEIGANACIDRATLGVTRIGRGVKIDNLVQIAHNVSIGENAALAAQCGIAGSSRVGPGVRLGGQAGLGGHLEVGAGAQVAARGGVIGNIAAGLTVSGYPARPHSESMRAEAALRRLPELLRRVRALERDRDSSEKKP